MRQSFKRILPTFVVTMALYTTYGYIIDYTNARTTDQILGLAFFAAILTTAIIWILWEIDRPTLKRDLVETAQEKQKRQRMDVLLRGFSEDEMHLLQARLQDLDRAKLNLADEEEQMRKHNES